MNPMGLSLPLSCRVLLPTQNDPKKLESNQQRMWNGNFSSKESCTFSYKTINPFFVTYLPSLHPSSCLESLFVASWQAGKRLLGGPY
jgi:hypothetical protein